MIDIRGRGGKSGGGGKEDPNTLQNKAKLRFLGLISEGPVEGFISTDPAKDILVNNLPLKDSAGNLNYEGVSYTYRSGLPDQEHIPGFTSGSSLVNLGDTNITVASPYTFTVSGNVDAAIVTVAIPALFDSRADKGLKKTTLNFNIQVKTSTGSYVTVHNKTYNNEKTVSRYEEDFRVNLPAGGSPWSIKITRTTPDATPAEETKLQNKLLAARYQPVVDGKFSYRNRAILATEIDAELFGGNSPTFKVRHRGIKCWVPKNYNPITRTYATSGAGTTNGAWDGTFKSAWTNNPAWILFDLITNNRYGLGSQFWKLTSGSQLTNGPTDALVDKWQLYVISQYCDVLVPNGFGGTEPRYTLNAHITNRQDAFRLLSAIVSTFRGMIYYAGGQVVFTVDKDDSATFEFTQANVIDGVFNYSSSSQKVLNSIAAVKWKDPLNYGRDEVEIYEDYDLIYSIGQKITEVDAFGCTSRGLARRIAKWTLLTEKLQGEIVTFSTGQEGAAVFPGAIINVYDPYKSGVRAGGRLVSVTPGATTVFTVDEYAIFPTGQNATITYINTSGLPVTKTISASNPGAKTYSVAENITDCLGDGSVFAIAWNSLKPQKYRVVATTENTEDRTYSITAIKHDATKYALVEQGISFEAPQTSLVSALKPTAPATLTINKWYTEILGAESESRVTFSWDLVKDGQNYDYELQIETTTEPYTVAYFGKNNTFTTEKLITTTTTEYRAKVRTVDSYGRTSLWTESALFSVAGDEVVPPTTGTPTVRSSLRVTEVIWTNPNLSDYKHTEVWVNTVNNSATATKVAEVRGTSYTYTHSDLLPKFFWTRTVTNSLVNNTSGFSPVVTATPLDPVSTQGVEIVSTLPTTGLFGGRVVFLTTDGKLYRYTGTAWTAAVPAVDITGTLTNAQIADLAATKITGTLTNAQIADLAATKITGTLTDAQIAAIAAAKLTGQITSTQITDNAITTAKINAGAITAAKIAADTITANEIAANAITATELAAGSVTTAKLVANAITANEIATDAVTAAKVQAGAIIAGKIAVDAVTAATIAAGAITTAKIAAGAITANEIATNAVTADKILAGAITTAKLAANSVVASTIAANSVSADKLAANSVTGREFSASETFVVGSGNNSFTITGKDPNLVAWAGSSNPGTANFRVSRNGTLTTRALLVEDVDGTILLDSSIPGLATEAFKTKTTSAVKQRSAVVANGIKASNNSTVAATMVAELDTTSNVGINLAFPVGRISELSTTNIPSTVRIRLFERFRPKGSGSFGAYTQIHSNSFTRINGYYYINGVPTTQAGWAATSGAMPTPTANQFRVIRQVDFFFEDFWNNGNSYIWNEYEYIDSPETTLSTTVSTVSKAAGTYEYYIIFDNGSSTVYGNNDWTGTITLTDTDGTADFIVGEGAPTGSGGTPGQFIYLTDTPTSYGGSAGQVVRVNGSATGLEFTASTNLIPTRLLTAETISGALNRIDSGFYQHQDTTVGTNWPTGGTEWQHLIASTHTNTGNNYSLQIGGSFYDQEVYVRKTNGSASQAWSRVWTSQHLNALNVSIGTVPNFTGYRGLYDVASGNYLIMTGQVGGDGGTYVSGRLSNSSVFIRAGANDGGRQIQVSSNGTTIVGDASVRSLFTVRNSSDATTITLDGSNGYISSSWQNHAAGTGMYSTVTGHYFNLASSSSDPSWFLRGGSIAGDMARLWFQRGDTGASVGCISMQADGNDIGFLHKGGNWRALFYSNAQGYLFTDAGVSREILTQGGIPVNAWINTADGTNRFWFSSGTGQNFYKSPNGYHGFRDGSDNTHTQIGPGMFFMRSAGMEGNAQIQFANQAGSQLYDHGLIWDGTNDFGTWSWEGGFGTVYRFIHSTKEHQFFTSQTGFGMRLYGARDSGLYVYGGDTVNTRWMQLRVPNNWAAYIETNNDRFYFNKEVQVDGALLRYDYTNGGFILESRNGCSQFWGDSPTMYFVQTAGTNRYTTAFHTNDQYFYILRHPTGGTVGWDSGANGRLPMVMDHANGNVTFSGNVTAYSDRNLKTNIVRIKDHWNVLDWVRGVTFNWIEGGQFDRGVIAQELQSVRPELVTTTKDGHGIDRLTVAYDKIIPDMLEMIRDLRDEIRRLKGE